MKSDPKRIEEEKVQVRNFELKSSNKKQDEFEMGDIGSDDSPGPFFSGHRQSQEK